MMFTIIMRQTIVIKINETYIQNQYQTLLGKKT